MKRALLCIIIGYLFGCVNPAALLAVVKKKNLREAGTKNLGATNVSMVIGKKYGVLVMVVDVMKAFLSSHIARLLFPQLRVAGLLAGCSAVIGHIFPVQMKFKGGKGLAAFGGMVLAYDPGVFLFLLITGVLLILITKYGIALPVYASSMAPFLAGIRAGSFLVFGIIFVVSCVIIYKHRENLINIKNGTEPKIRAVIDEHF